MLSRKGFSLIEILVSLLVLSGAIATMFSGFETASQLNHYSNFESEAAFLAEREIEMLKSDLIKGRRKPGPASAASRFVHKPGFKISSVWSKPDANQTVRIQCSVNQLDRSFELESFVYLPDGGQDS